MTMFHEPFSLILFQKQIYSLIENIFYSNQIGVFKLWTQQY